MIWQNQETEYYDSLCDICGYRRSGFDSEDEAESALGELGYIHIYGKWICPNCTKELSDKIN